MAYIPTMLTPEEIERYKRQLVLKEIGGEGQQKLKSAFFIFGKKAPTDRLLPTTLQG